MQQDIMKSNIIATGLIAYIELFQVLVKLASFIIIIIIIIIITEANPHLYQNYFIFIGNFKRFCAKLGKQPPPPPPTHPYYIWTHSSETLDPPLYYYY